MCPVFVGFMSIGLFQLLQKLNHFPSYCHFRLLFFLRHQSGSVCPFRIQKGFNQTDSIIQNHGGFSVLETFHLVPLPWLQDVTTPVKKTGAFFLHETSPFAVLRNFKHQIHQVWSLGWTGSELEGTVNSFLDKVPTSNRVWNPICLPLWRKAGQHPDTPGTADVSRKEVSWLLKRVTVVSLNLKALRRHFSRLPLGRKCSISLSLGRCTPYLRHLELEWSRWQFSEHIVCQNINQQTNETTKDVLKAVCQSRALEVAGFELENCAVTVLVWNKTMERLFRLKHLTSIFHLPSSWTICRMLHPGIEGRCWIDTRSQDQQGIILN